jgi:hypothetical protein
LCDVTYHKTKLRGEDVKACYVARPVKLKDALGISIRVPGDLLEELDLWVEEIRASGGIGTSDVTRSDIVRDIVRRALEERRAARTGPTAKPVSTPKPKLPEPRSAKTRAKR